MEIASIIGLSEKSKNLDTSISELKQMKEITFVETTEQLEDATQKLIQQKQQYTSLIGASSDEEITSTIQSQRYEVEYLWVKLGNHATKNGITLKMDIVNGGASQNKLYNLKFTASGNYVNLTEFIYEVENDSTLGFKIENFKLLPSGVDNTAQKEEKEENKGNTTKVLDYNNLVSTFLVKNVYIDLDKITSNTLNNQSNDNNNTTTENTIDESNNQSIDEMVNYVQ